MCCFYQTISHISDYGRRRIRGAAAGVQRVFIHSTQVNIMMNSEKYCLFDTLKSTIDLYTCNDCRVCVDGGGTYSLLRIFHPDMTCSLLPLKN